MLPIAIYRQHIDIDIDFDVFDILLLINFVCLTTKVLNVGFLQYWPFCILAQLVTI